MWSQSRREELFLSQSYYGVRNRLLYEIGAYAALEVWGGDLAAASCQIISRILQQPENPPTDFTTYSYLANEILTLK